jgi:PRTRC genetic system protein F
MVATAILERHPALWEGLDQFTVSESCNHVISQWLIEQGVADEGGCLSIDSQDTGRGPSDTVLALTLGCVWMVLEEPVRRAEQGAPGLGWTVLALLEELDGTLSIVTPRYAKWMGVHRLWYGLDKDSDFREEWENMYEDATEEDWEAQYKPSDFSNSFNDPQVLKAAERRRLSGQELERLCAEHADSWIRDLAAVLRELANLGEHAGTSVRQPDAGETHSPYPMHPMAVVRWSEDDGMAHVVDQWVSDEEAAGEAPFAEFFWNIETPESAVDAIDHFESGFMRLRPFMKLARLLENNHET